MEAEARPAFIPPVALISCRQTRPAFRQNPASERQNSRRRTLDVRFSKLADIAAYARRGRHAPATSPIAFEAVQRIDALFDIEGAINGLDADLRPMGQELSRPLSTTLEA
ncbi:MAG: hypothetical protein EOS61_02930 [Mesorhizobium sp.]|uniref:hypothetical protein n=1 Tax=Mesorhizobium sp. TaxID=1871066 RepID=UPI000FE4DF8F|nr:hypothetical protein [Mesorhizobium sp.]RWB94149.1 MAG: hypothetical protein EOQ57_32510 [Mesorhizobium sp.]RWE17413.1 MAG: hypothetical protein EOS61_02930 [Mesorhizobium sp.]TIS44430.1 MAG: hypothetical protein E5W96_36450 [Mesorhizobium sp.]